MQGSGEHYGQRHVAVLGLGNHIIKQRNTDQVINSLLVTFGL